jgi:hypothetical protein|tara:strand:- start:68 stop:178 length:111 start_codon:yes stop_codon:yes gene_type:complete
VVGLVVVAPMAMELLTLAAVQVEIWVAEMLVDLVLL